MHKGLINAVIWFLLMGGVVWAAPEQRGGTPVGASSAAQQEAPVVFDGKTLFVIREKVFSYTPADRALAISDKLGKLVKDPMLNSDNVMVVEAETATDIVMGDKLIMVVTDQDAGSEGKTRQETAKEYAASIRAALQVYVREHSREHLLLAILYVIAATIVLIVLLVISKWGFRKVLGQIESWRGTRIRSLSIKSHELIKEDWLIALLISCAKGVRVILLLALFYFYIHLMFSFFPMTRGVAATVFGYIMTPFKSIGQALGGYLPNLFYVAVIILITRYVMKFVQLFFAEIGKGTIVLTGFDPDWAGHTCKIVYFLLIAFAAVVAFPYLPGSKSEAFKGISIFLGVLFSLGSTSAVANIVAGLILTYTNAFKIGDRIRIGENFGDVEAKSLLVTRIKTPKNVMVTIPNSMVIGSHISNYSATARKGTLILHSSVTIGYDAPWRKVHELLIAAAGATEHVLGTPPPFVLQTALNDFYVTYELNAHTDQPHLMVKTYSDLHQNIQDKFNEAGVEIMSPHYAQIRDGNKTAIPDAYLPEGYTAGGMRIVSTSPLEVKTGNEAEGREHIS